MRNPKVIHGLCYSLTSPHLPSRKAAAEILVFFCHWEEEGVDRVGLEHVLQGLSNVESHHNNTRGIGQKVGRFDIWLQQLSTTVDGRGRMGSTVGLSKDLKGTDDGTILDICVSLHTRSKLTTGHHDLPRLGHYLLQRYPRQNIHTFTTRGGRTDRYLPANQGLAGRTDDTDDQAIRGGSGT